MSNPSQKNLKVLWTKEFIMLADVVSKRCDTLLQPIPRAMLMQRIENLDEIQSP
jgi:hypothetical protein